MKTNLSVSRRGRPKNDFNEEYKKAVIYFVLYNGKEKVSIQKTADLYKVRADRLGKILIEYRKHAKQVEQDIRISCNGNLNRNYSKVNNGIKIEALSSFLNLSKEEIFKRIDFKGDVKTIGYVSNEVEKQVITVKDLVEKIDSRKLDNQNIIQILTTNMLAKIKTLMQNGGLSLKDISSLSKCLVDLNKIAGGGGAMISIQNNIQNNTQNNFDNNKENDKKLEINVNVIEENINKKDDNGS